MAGIFQIQTPDNLLKGTFLSFFSSIQSGRATGAMPRMFIPCPGIASRRLG